MSLVDASYLLGRQLAVGLPPKGAQEQAAAHSHSTMDLPNCQFDSFGFQRLPPRQDVLVHAIHKRSVEVEEDSGLPFCCSSFRTAYRDSSSYGIGERGAVSVIGSHGREVTFPPSPSVQGP